MDAWFNDVPVLGNLSPLAAADKLDEFGEDDAAVMLRSAAVIQTEHTPVLRGSGITWPFQNRPWQHTAHAFGYIAARVDEAGSDHELPIVHAGNMQPDTSLKGQRIKVTLAGLRAAAYPGSGSRRILFDFYAQNQVPGNVEHLHFNATFRVADTSHVAVLGYPLFIGLTVSNEGLSFKCYTVNVGNDGDDTLLSFLESDVFRAGLKLTNELQPALAPLSAMAFNLTKAVAKRNRNVPVQDFHLGLDFADVGVGARLAEGTYVAVQMSEADYALWEWNSWVYDRNNGRIISRDDRTRLIPHNYVMFTVARYTEG